MRRVASHLRSDRHEVSPEEATPALGTARRELIETVGRLCQRLGLPRSTGQIYGLLYLSPRPLALEEIAELLQISKASVSTGARHLLSWQAVRQVWIPGERRDHYETAGDIRELLRAGYEQFLLPKLEKSGRKLEKILASLEADRREGLLDKAEHAFCKDRLLKLAALEQRARRLLPLAEKFL